MPLYNSSVESTQTAPALSRRFFYPTTNMHQFIRFRLNISYDQYLTVYQGISQTIRTRDVQGRVIEFPARNIQSFLTKDGIYGYFEMELTEQNKFVGIKRLSQ